MKFWLCVTSQENWEVVKKFGVWGVSERNRRKVESADVGDLLVFYVKPKKIADVMRTSAKAFKREEKIFRSAGFAAEEVFHTALKLKLFKYLSPLSFEEFIEKLRFIKRKEKWTGYLRGAMRTVPKEDFDLIKSRISSG